jgi:hypothetical protein
MSTVTLTTTTTEVTVSSPPRFDVELATQEPSITVTPGGNKIHVTTALQGPPGIGIDQSFEVTSKNLKAYPVTLNWISGRLVSMVYIMPGGMSIIKILNYTGSQLDSVVLSGDTPGGIALTKTLTWVNGALTQVGYS